MSPPDLLVLHTLRCIGFASLNRVAAASGLAEPDVESELIDLAAAGLVTKLAGGFGGWGLSDSGRVLDTARIADELDASGARDALTEAYQRFLVLNPQLLDLCTAWQMRSAALNDHTDPAYDARVLSMFGEFDRRAAVVCADLSAALLRFARYRERLAGALARARAGAVEYLTDDLDSYHNAWFQLHEDLLVTLGIPRR